MTKVIARVQAVHLMNLDWAPGGRQPSDQANRLGLWVRRKSAGNVHIHHRQCHYYTQPISWCSFFRPTDGGRLSGPRYCSRSAQPVPKTVYHSSCRDKHNRPRCDSNLGPLTRQSDALATRLLRPALLCNSRAYPCSIQYTRAESISWASLWGGGLVLSGAGKSIVFFRF